VRLSFVLGIEDPAIGAAGGFGAFFSESKHERFR